MGETRAIPKRSIVAVALAVAVVATAMPAQAGRSPLKPASRGTYFGSYVPPREWTVRGQKAAIRRFETAIRRKLDIVNIYYPWDKPFPNWREPWHLRRGRIPMISWNGTSTRQILSGSEDRMIRARADAVRGLRRRVFLRFFWEMDGANKEAWVGSPRRFVRAWRHVHKIFERRGATNAVWVWAPNAWAFESGEAKRYYPGNRYVDWVAGDGYNWGWDRWDSFADDFAAMYRQFRGKKPMMVAETGAVEQGGNKARWIRKTAKTLRRRFPQIRAFVWFNSIDGRWDWRVDTSRRSMRAYRRMAQRAYFNPRH